MDKTTNADMIVRYAERVYAYAVKRTYTQSEAEDLSQEILCTAVRELHKLRDSKKFEGWLWGIANNVTNTHRRRMAKERTFYCYDALDEIDIPEESDDEENEAIYDELRTKIAMLSSIYREIIVLYYYDRLSTKEIARRLSVPEGTVTWRLHEARRKLKKECHTMETSALYPKRIALDIYGSGNFTDTFPSELIGDALSQNILYYCYEKPRSTEELIKLCGVPAYYIEERLDNLLKREAVIEAVHGKYMTDFIIWSDKYGIYCEENAESAMLPIMDKMSSTLLKISKDAYKIGHYKAGKSENDLFYLYGIMAFDCLCSKHCRLPNPKIKEKRDGFGWCYIGSMETGLHPRIRITKHHCPNIHSRGNYAHIVYSGFGGVSFRNMMYNEQINACEDILLCGRTKSVDDMLSAIEKGYIIRGEDRNLQVTCPAFSKEEKSEFDAVAEKYLSELMPQYSDLLEGFINGYKTLFPPHISDDADRMCYSMFTGFYSVFIAYMQKNSLVAPPSAGCICDVMTAYR